MPQVENAVNEAANEAANGCVQNFAAVCCGIIKIVAMYLSSVGLLSIHYARI